MFVQDFPEIQQMLIDDTEVKVILLERTQQISFLLSSIEIGKQNNIWKTTETQN